LDKIDQKIAVMTSPECMSQTSSVVRHVAPLCHSLASRHPFIARRAATKVDDHPSSQSLSSEGVGKTEFGKMQIVNIHSET
jgi:hypothetical protein